MRIRQGNSWHYFSNADVTPYSFTLMKKYDCQVNLEFVSSVKSVKYCYKHICKGPDRMAAEISLDETENHADGRYLTGPEGF